MRLGHRNDIAVVDTNIVSILSQEKFAEEARYYRAQLRERNLYVSFITVHEVRWGIRNAGFGERRTREILADLAQYGVEWPAEELIDAAVELRYLCRHQQLSFHDLFIAATALKLDCPLATDDGRLAEALADAGITGIISRHL